MGGSRQLLRVSLDQRLEPRLRHRIGSPVRFVGSGGSGRDEDRAASIRSAKQRIARPDKPPVGGEIGLDDIGPDVVGHMPERRQVAEHAGVADQDVELAPALE